MIQELFDLTGKIMLVKTIPANTSSTTIPVSHLANGLYLLRIEQGGYAKTIRVTVM